MFQNKQFSASRFRSRKHFFVACAALAASTIAVSAHAQVAAPTAWADATNVHFTVAYTGTPTWTHVYIDKDRSVSSGYAVYGVGADYMIENGRLYKYAGTNGSWAWTSVKAVTATPSTGTTALTVARTDLGSPTAINFVAQTDAPLNVSAVIQASLTTSTTSPTAPGTTTSGWTACATEGGTCSFTGTMQVRYGANGLYATKTMTGPVACTNAVFGDPAPKQVKTCSYSAPTTSTTPPPTTSPTPAPGTTVSVNYTGTTAAIANPERGFYRHISCDAPLSLSQLKGYRTTSSSSMMLCVFYLRNFVTSPISQSALDLFQQQMNTVRSAGMKAIVRFAYNDNNIATDAKPAMVNTHLTQLAPYLAANKDVIAFVQAGLIGSWGEWGATQNYGDSYNMTAQNMADRKSVVDKLLSVVPAERMVQLRMPIFKTKLYTPTGLTSTEAFTNTAKARLGFHNDCFLSNSSDYGTYVNPSVETPYLASESTYVPTGGETCAYVPPRSDCPSAVAEMTKFHWSYLNLDYNQTVLNNWKNQGCFAQVDQKLGYRFVLTAGSFSGSAKPGGTFAVNLTVQNQGWASTYNSRDVELVFRNTATGALTFVKLAADPRRWLANQKVTINQTVTLPSTMAKGTYALLLNLPDPQPSLRNRPDYSIQMANSNTWEAATGFNNLNHTVGIAP
ncbi:MAG: DUF4832 domain-containing protein [Massilia sp.]